MRAHDVRQLRVCKHCGDFGSRRLMIVSEGETLHTNCFYLTHTWQELLALPSEDRGKFRIADMPPAVMRELVAFEIAQRSAVQAGEAEADGVRRPL